MRDAHFRGNSSGNGAASQPDDWSEGPLDPKDRMLHAFLEETLGGITPPDLSDQILAALASRRQRPNPTGDTSCDAADQSASPAPGRAIPNAGGEYLSLVLKSADDARDVAIPALAPPVAVSGRGDSPRGVAHRHKPRRSYLLLVAGAALAVAGVFLIISRPWEDADPIVAPERRTATGRDQGATAIGARGNGRSSANSQKSRGIASKDVPRNDAQDAHSGGDEESEFNVPPPFAIGDAGSSDAIPHSDNPGRARADYADASPSSDEDVIRFVNDEIRRRWDEHRVAPAEPATDAEWCRRAYLRLLGRIPTVEELEQFVDSSESGKHERLVDELLGLEGDRKLAYRDEYARHWAAWWTNLLIGRTGGQGGGSLGDRQQLETWLRQEILEETPLNELAFQLISATGANVPGSDDYNAAVNFLLANMQGPGDKMTLATARTSRVFLGRQLQCVQCHPHHSNDTSQYAFWALNSFFRQTAAESAGATGAMRLVNRDFRGEGRRGDGREAEVYYEQPNGALKAAYPQFVDGTTISPSGLISEVDRRTELARLIVSSDDLSRATVNRFWSHFFGFGFTEPVDDLGPHRTVSHPEALERLAREFTAHGHDLKRLTRWIALSEPFRLSSKAPTGEQIASHAGPAVANADFSADGEPLFRRYYMRQMQPEEVYKSLLVAAGKQPGDAATDPERAAWLSQFARRLGTDDGHEINAFDGSIQQSLAVMNGPLMRQAASPEQNAMLARVSASDLPLDQKIEHLFLAAIARSPSSREMDAARQLCESQGENVAAALQDLWWALLNSNEFILDH